MIQIKEMSTRSGVPVKTIRYYEQIGLLPPARRAENGYRTYDEVDVNRLRFIKNARALGFHLIEIAQILSVQDRNEPPCSHVMSTLQHHLDEIENRIRELESLRGDLEALYEAGKRLPQDVQMRNCVCHLIQLGDTKGDDDGKGN